jgi:hypothetical protein
MRLLLQLVYLWHHHQALLHLILIVTVAHGCQAAGVRARQVQRVAVHVAVQPAMKATNICKEDAGQQ